MISVSALLAFTILLQVPGTGMAADSRDDSNDADKDTSEWKLKHHEDFSEDLDVNDADWVRDEYGEDSPWKVTDGLGDDGAYFHALGGDDFERKLDSFWLMRKRVSFGEDDWLTAELAVRDYDKKGEPDNPVTFDNVTMPDGNRAAKLDEDDHSGGGIIRSTDPLPPEYRIEYKLKTIDFGGQRDGSFEYDGKINGYDTEGVKTNYPWATDPDAFSGPDEPGNSNFGDVRSANGYYFLSILDYNNPAPHNNAHIHSHRKVNMDAYNVNGPEGDAYSVCDPGSGDLYNYNSSKSTQNGINALFMNGDEFKDHDYPYTDFLIETECGNHTGDIVSAAEIQPELMPDEDYTFAIERDKTGYTMEMSGNFLHAGEKNLRYHRDFVEGDEPIWHYNNRPDQYNGEFNRTWSRDTPNGEYKEENMWPEDSAYPDYFILGDPHLTHYEGAATIDDIKLYVPEEIDTDYIQTQLWQLDDANDIKNDEAVHDLKLHLQAVEHYEKENASEKVSKHMKGFNNLLLYQKNEDLINGQAYQTLKESADSLIEDQK
ncbi:hypothetical protein KFZ56_16140 [Virgibacillus sp. NKC19-3]|uniref:FIMAH domain-containing protein n=1 Tax=Virgibacillus saliphilus TaxID=2831674 RepID=UPI001C9BB493|nr:hypothetical protein [Virgibacillus sp. NKC19-3]MBY7144552.1 hypothetical protein [Virgibacillus sp. NKC19-3]